MKPDERQALHAEACNTAAIQYLEERLSQHTAAIDGITPQNQAEQVLVRCCRTFLKDLREAINNANAFADSKFIANMEIDSARKWECVVGSYLSAIDIYRKFGQHSNTVEKEQS